MIYIYMIMCIYIYIIIYICIIISQLQLLRAITARTVVLQLDEFWSPYSDIRQILSITKIYLSHQLDEITLIITNEKINTNMPSGYIENHDDR
jgi:hypothetical protein